MNQCILFIRSLLFSIGLILSMILFSVIALLILPLSYERRYRILGKWGDFSLWWLDKTCHLRYEVSGLENIPPTPAIVLSKHQSAWETIALRKIFPMQTWVLKRELLWIPFFGWAIATLEPIPINRGIIRRSMQDILERGKRHLEKGHFVIIFPEGTRVTQGQKKRFGLGGAWLAAHSGYPVIPVAHNSGRFWSRQGFLKYPGTIQVKIGSIIDSRGKTPQEINTLTETWIENAMTTLEQ